MLYTKYFFWFLIATLTFLFIFDIKAKRYEADIIRYNSDKQYDEMKQLLMTIKKSQDSFDLRQNLMKIKQDSMSKFFDLQTSDK